MVGRMAERRGRPFRTFYFLALIFNPLLLMLVLAFIKIEQHAPQSSSASRASTASDPDADTLDKTRTTSAQA